MSEVILEPRLVGDIAGDFFIPSYQRGYRWGESQVRQLLDDIYENGGNSYCLQPVVVKKRPDDTYELIDGQQRMTTLWLIMTYIKKYKPMMNINFSITYETRKDSSDFLSHISDEGSEEKSKVYIDFFHMYEAYTTIKNWFEISINTTLTADNIYKYLCENVKVIWYEASDNDDERGLFTRLNIGKIKLTNAELVRALFLSEDGREISLEKQLEIATTWDNLEKELRDDDLWYFLTNKRTSDYSTRIELIFDMMSKRSDNEKDEYSTFFYFIDRIKDSEGGGPQKVWEEIQNYFLYLKNWYDNRELFHKVGYLITVGKSISELVEMSKDKLKSEFLSILDEEIKKTISPSRDRIHPRDHILSLSYEKAADKAKIEKVLLLFNVESVLRQKNSRERYPFFEHKNNEWTLEHIHAQHSDGLNKMEDRKKWLQLHKKSLEDMQQKDPTNEVLGKMIKKIVPYIENGVEKNKFDELSSEIVAMLSETNESNDYLHTISNMALLSSENNSALNNSTFDVKRNMILDMDKNGEYIPLCTKRAFLKYYTESKHHQLHFWSDADRKAYILAMLGDNEKEGVITKYLSKDGN